MKLKNSYFYTIRENVKDEDSKSGNFLARSGMVKKSSAGVYIFLPLGLKILKNIENIIREEMDNIACQEVLMPSLIPEEVYIESGRRESFGNGMFSLKDRAGRPFVLGPTHEELFCMVAHANVQSYKDLPFSLYQFQNKFRDEARPRFGLIRVREFIMKDSYSFDRDLEGLNQSYDAQYNAYTRIFNRLGLDFKVVQADTGEMGGLLSEEFQAVAEIGEDLMVLCHHCDFANNLEIATCPTSSNSSNETLLEKELVETPNVKSIEDVQAFLKQPQEKIVKTLLYMADDKIVACLVRGDREINELKLRKALKAKEIVLATEEQAQKLANSPIGFVGPIGLTCDIIMDDEISHLQNFVVGANQKDHHFINVNHKDFTPTQITNIRVVQDGDVCPICGNPVYLQRGIEVGNTFKLGTKYSETSNLMYSTPENQMKPVWMGSYGIGVARTMAAIAEQKADEFGIAWPMNIAPFKVAVVVISDKDEVQMEVAEKIYNDLKIAGIECLFDDRNERPGIKFKDMELIGIPLRITVGRGASDGLVEFQTRSGDEKAEIAVADCVATIRKYIEKN